jgi:tetratricopeptide (TPR) repeat protein
MARAARDQGFYGQALDEVAAALPALAPGSDEQVKALLMQAELFNLAGQLRRSLVVAARAHGILLARGDRTSSLYARATMDLARLEAARLHVETAERRFDECEDLLERQGETLGLVWLALRRARLWLDLGRNAEVRRALEEIVVAEPREKARALHLVGVSWFQDGDFERALELCLEAESTARAAGDVFGGLGIRVSRLEAEVELGRGTLAACDAIRADAERSRLPRQVLRAERLAARVLREAGQPEAALERVRRALAQVRTLSIEPTVVLGVWLEKALTLAALGRDDEAQRARLHARRYLERLAARFAQRRDRQRFLRATPIRRALLA